MKMFPVRRRTRSFGALLLMLGVAACAANSVGRRAAAIADDDREAKRVLAMESQIDPAKIPARTISVLPFTVATRDTTLRAMGYALADFLITDLSRSPQLQLLERQHIEAVMRQLEMVDQGQIDPRTAPRVGRLIGARRVVIGDLTPSPDGSVLLTVRIVDVISGTVANAVTASAPLSRMIDAEKSLAVRVFEQLNITLTPAQLARVEERPTTSVAATVAYGRGIEAEAKGDAIGAVGAFQEAVRLDATFAAARTQAASAAPATNSRANNGIARVLALSAQAINAPASTRVADAADLPLQANQLFTLLLTIRVF